MTTKRLAWKTCLKELLWFIKGDTDNKHLKDQNVHIWDTLVVIFRFTWIIKS